MKGLDTNVLVRYLTQDDPKQAAVAVKEIEWAAARNQKMLLHPLVLCELVWVLESAYGFDQAEILKTLERILRTAQFELLEKDILWLALADYRRGKGDFSDYYLGRANERAGAEITLTFDLALKSDPRFEILSATRS
jgi:predicted nucleic-acid-binding protein